ncbi:MAG: long-chain fatty acid--CoA ligase [Parvibaculum sp.]|nr:long-chain fatty acid--CoA ligase [Parvibaculum sp.]
MKLAPLVISPDCDTVPKLFVKRAKELGPRVAMRDKKFGLWEPISWNDYYEKARASGLALKALGLSDGGRIAIVSEVCPEWLFVDLGCMGVGGVSMGIYSTDTAPQVEYIMNDCAAEFYFAENEEQLDKILEVRDRIPSLKRIVVFDMEGLHDFHDPMVMGFDAFIDLGRKEARDAPKRFDEAVGKTEPGDTAILVYTSGTTGPPKGAMISHANIMFQIENNQNLLPHTPEDRSLAFLPLCHIAERTFTTFNQLMTGQTVNFAENLETVPENLREVQPTAFFAVPRIWEKFYSTVSIALKDATLAERLAYRWAIGVGEKVADRRIAGEPVSAVLNWYFKLADLLVLKNIRKMIGIDSCRYILSGAAPISPELIRWYFALGLYMAEGYGQTENAGIATIPQPFGTYKFGLVGKPVPNTELRLAEDGEILMRGPHVFLGYWNKPDKTAETVIDGWLHTGDIGTIDNEGWVRITDRKKDIIITAGGKNITPSEIENELKFSPYIQDAVVIGDRRKFLSALIMIDRDNVEKFAQDANVPFSDFRSLCRAAEVQELLQAEIDRANKKFARVETIKKFRVIEHQIQAEDDEITATGKLKRSLVNEKYATLIEGMYKGEAA